jgi:hypothetical protein
MSKSVFEKLAVNSLCGSIAEQLREAILNDLADNEFRKVALRRVVLPLLGLQRFVVHATILSTDCGTRGRACPRFKPLKRKIPRELAQPSATCSVRGVRRRRNMYLEQDDQAARQAPIAPAPPCVGEG